MTSYNRIDETSLAPLAHSLHSTEGRVDPELAVVVIDETASQIMLQTSEAGSSHIPTVSIGPTQTVREAVGATVTEPGLLRVVSPEVRPRSQSARRQGPTGLAAVVKAVGGLLKMDDLRPAFESEGSARSRLWLPIGVVVARASVAPGRRRVEWMTVDEARGQLEADANKRRGNLGKQFLDRAIKFAQEHQGNS